SVPGLNHQVGQARKSGSPAFLLRCKSCVQSGLTDGSVEDQLFLKSIDHRIEQRNHFLRLTQEIIVLNKYQRLCIVGEIEIRKDLKIFVDEIDSHLLIPCFFFFSRCPVHLIHRFPAGSSYHVLQGHNRSTESICHVLIVRIETAPLEIIHDVIIHGFQIHHILPLDRDQTLPQSLHTEIFFQPKYCSVGAVNDQ